MEFSMLFVNDSFESAISQWTELCDVVNGSIAPCTEMFNDADPNGDAYMNVDADVTWPNGEQAQLALSSSMLYLLGLRALNNTTAASSTLSRKQGPGHNLRTAEGNHTLSLNYASVEFYLVALLLITLAIWTAIGSFLVDLSIIKFRSLRTVPNILVGNLSISDFLLAVTILPMSIANDLLGYWVFGRWLCYLWLVGDVLYCTASIWSLCVIAFDRFTATVFPMWYRDQRSPQRAVWYIIADWVLSLLIIIPPMTGWMKLSDCYLEDRDHPGLMQCQLFTDDAYVLYSSMGSFIVPLLVMCALYGKIFAVLWNRSNPKRHATMMTTRRAAEMTLAPVVALTGNIKCSQLIEKSKSIKRMQIKTSLTINPLSMDGDTDVDVDVDADADADDDADGNATTKHMLTTIKQNNSVQVATVSSSNSSSKCDQSHSTTDTIASDAARLHLDANKTLKVFRGVRFGTKNNRRKSSATPEESDSNDLIGEQSLTANSQRPSVSNPQQQQPQQKRRSTAHNFSKSLHRRETQATLRAMLIIIIFVLCWIPFTVMYVVGGFMKENFSLNPHAVRFIIWLGYANSAMNPILIFCYNRDFKAAFKAITYTIFCSCSFGRSDQKMKDAASRFEHYRRRKRKGATSNA